MTEGIETDAGNQALLLGAGYEPVRSFYDMVAPSLEGSWCHPCRKGSSCVR